MTDLPLLSPRLAVLAYRRLVIRSDREHDLTVPPALRTYLLEGLDAGRDAATAPGLRGGAVWQRWSRPPLRVAPQRPAGAQVGRAAARPLRGTIEWPRAPCSPFWRIDAPGPCCWPCLPRRITVSRPMPCRCLLWPDQQHRRGQDCPHWCDVSTPVSAAARSSSRGTGWLFRCRRAGGGG